MRTRVNYIYWEPVTDYVERDYDITEEEALLELGRIYPEADTIEVVSIEEID
jgi:hypothetical protein